MLTTREFLETVVTCETGYFCFAVGNNETNWKEIWFQWPNDLDQIVKCSEELCEETNVYFSTYLFKSRSTTKDNVLPGTRTIQADLDDADINNLPVPPTILVQTSPGRHQGYWLLSEAVDLELHEILSRKLTYAISECDHSGWPLGRKVRVANTYNYKYLEGRKPVTIVATSSRKYQPAHLELLPDPPANINETINDDFLNNHTPIDIGPLELLEKIKDKIPPEVYTNYEQQAQDRSVALWKLMCSAFRAGLSRDEVFWLAKNSANNKFAGLNYNADRELAKDVLRAEGVVSSGIVDARDIISQARKLSGSQHDKRQHMLDIVSDIMSIQGRFIRTPEDNAYYIRNDVGRPILMSEHSEYLLVLLDMEFGLNPTEPETKFIAAGLCNKARVTKTIGLSSSLSHYDNENEILFLHTGRRDVLRVTKSSLQSVTDGAYDLIFPWTNSFEPFDLDFTPLDKPWDEFLFGDTAENITGMEKNQARVLLKIWLLFLFFRSSSVSRPILALFGAPGSGKSTTFRKLYAFLYGKNRSLGAVTTAEDFDYAVSTDPLVVLDNVDTWERWLPDRMALAASTSDIVKRKLFTDFSTVTIKRQSLLAVTAHDPKFGREDVTDRLLILNLKRLEKFRAEGPIIDEVYRNRSRLFGSLVRDIQRILAEPEPNQHDLPQIRVEDFARLGYRIACALNCRDDFVGAIDNLRAGQKSFVLAEESILVDGLRKIVARDKKNGEQKYRTTGEIWMLLSTLVDEKPLREMYHNAPTLGKKLWSLYDSLRSIMKVEFKFDTVRTTRVWKFSEKENVGDT